jgi:hypothetical protein
MISPVIKRKYSRGTTHWYANDDLGLATQDFGGGRTKW